jgi:hypothetical protein
MHTKLRNVVLLGMAAMWLGLAGGTARASDVEVPTHEAVEHRHHLELFLGNTHTEDDEDAFSFGLGYEYRLTHFLGIGVLGEYAVKDIDAWVVGVPLAIHPGAGWRLVVMPGLELHDGDSEFLFRTGVGYEFEVDRYTIMPEFNADFVDDEVNYVFGVGLGVKF